MILNMTACGKSDGLDRVFKYDISDNPATLDPQQANEPNSDIIIENVYMGLMAINADGSVRAAAATDFAVSDDGLKYNFKLRNDIYWVNSEGFRKQCTARDFVYGFTRLFLPETSAPRAGEYFCIKNSEQFNSGKITDPSLLGVKAKGDFELEITLEYANPRLPEMLAEPPAMPCNEEFFLQSQGKYGLSAECTPSNGSFYVKSWTYDPYASTDINNLILRRNDKNAESIEICPSGLNFFIEDEEDFIDDFLSGDVSCVAVVNSDKSRVKGKNKCEEFCNITCGLAFNTDFKLFRNADFRRALSLLIDRETIMAAIPDFEAAGGIVPKQVSLLNQSYRTEVGDCGMPGYNPEKARTLFQSAKSSLDLELFTGAVIIVPNTVAETAVSYIMQEWQREFGFYCVVQVLGESEYLSRLRSGNFDIAMLELSGSYNSPAAYLERFTSGSSDNFSHVSDSGFDAKLSAANAAAELSEGAKIFLQAEQLLIDNAEFVPLYYKNEYFFTGSDISDLLYNPFTKTVNFTSAKRF